MSDKREGGVKKPEQMGIRHLRMAPKAKFKLPELYVKLNKSRKQTSIYKKSSNPNSFSSCLSDHKKNRCQKWYDKNIF